MPVYIYNSLTRKKEELSPLSADRVNIYSCGVTVYDACHIGHARSLYIFDILRRYLKYRGFNVKFVRNITDIDDKIIERAKELKLDWKGLVKKYTDSYYDDLAALGIEKADYEPKATENIDDMKRHIKALLDKGYAYVTDSGVYFRVRRFKEYGKLSGQSIEQMLAGARKEPDETKEDRLDFALWKKSKAGEPSWMSPWGGGRPGWHIECSTMSTKYLETDTLDVHAGGQDLIFPHHENEIAQSEALTSRTFARHWIHHGLLTVNRQKMSKSLGNFVTINDFLKQYASWVLKLFFLSAHYHSPLDYNAEALHIASENAKTINVFFQRIADLEFGNSDAKEAEEFRKRFIQAMDDDQNTPVALSILLEMISSGNKNIDRNNLGGAAAIAKALYSLLEVLNLKELKNLSLQMPPDGQTAKALCDLQDIYQVKFTEYGIGLISSKDSRLKEQDQARLIDNFLRLRSLARKRRDFLLSDEIRDALHKKAGIILEDAKDGRTTWRKKV